MSGAIWGTPIFGATISDNKFLSLKNLNNWDREYMADVEITYDPYYEHNRFKFTAEREAAERFIIKRAVIPNEYYVYSMRVAAASYDAVYGPNDVCMAVCSEYPDRDKYIGLQTEILVADVTDMSAEVDRHYSVPFYSGDLEEVYLVIDFAAILDFQEVQFDVSAITLHLSSVISYARKPFNINMLDGDIWNFIAVEPGAWFHNIYDDHQVHHVHFLSGDEFKVLEFTEAATGGVIPHGEHHSEPIIIDGRKYHSLYISWPVEAVCPFPTAYYPLAEMPSDESIYAEISEYVINYETFERGDVLGLWALRDMLSTHLGESDGYWVSIESVEALLDGYTVEEYQNPYLDEPHLNNPDWYQETHKQ